MSSGKTGYEIRADLLSLAEGILINNIENERQTIYMWNDNHPCLLYTSPSPRDRG